MELQTFSLTYILSVNESGSTLFPISKKCHCLKGYDLLLAFLSNALSLWKWFFFVSNMSKWHCSRLSVYIHIQCVLLYYKIFMPNIIDISLSQSHRE